MATDTEAGWSFDATTSRATRSSRDPESPVPAGAAVAAAVQTTLDGKPTQLTKTSEGSLHYHPQPSPDGKWLVYGSMRDGVRNIYVLNIADRTETQLTHLKPGHGALWPHWQPLQ